MAREVPTHEEFLESCRSAFRFLVDEFGFQEAPCASARPQFCIRFAKDDRSLEIRGEGYGTTAACDLSCGSRGPFSLIYLVPDAFRPKRSRKRDRMGQLDHIREWGEFARAHAADFFSGDTSRFARLFDTRPRMRPPT